MNAMVAHPAMTVIMRFSFLSFRRCAFLCLSIRSACSGRNSVFIRGAVAPGSELGLRTVYVKGIVMMPTTVRTKKGKNCPCDILAYFQTGDRKSSYLFIVRIVCSTHFDVYLVSRPAPWKILYAQVGVVYKVSLRVKKRDSARY